MKDQKRHLTLLSGGTGTPKLLLGLRYFLKDDEFTVIGNTGDDDHFYGLHVSPDVDTLIYLFAGKLDLDKYWGIHKDSFITNSMLKELQVDAWFNLGDKDLALHLLRNKLLLEGLTLEKVTMELCKRLSVKANVLPMSNEQIKTTFYTTKGEKLSFQEYTVKYGEKKKINKVEYQGNINANITNKVREAITKTNGIIIGPSNPITSINPMLALPSFRKELIKSKVPIIAISPIQTGKAFSGPVVKLLTELQIEPSPIGIVSLYKDFLDKIVISPEDKELKEKIEADGVEVIITDINLSTEEKRKNLARTLLKELEIKY